jgi:WD40 repeat protein
MIRRQCDWAALCYLNAILIFLRRNFRILRQVNLLGAILCVTTIVLPSVHYHKLRCKILTAASLKMIAVWDIEHCSLVEVDGRFEGAYCLHHHAIVYFCKTSRRSIPEGCHFHYHKLDSLPRHSSRASCTLHHPTHATRSPSASVRVRYWDTEDYVPFAKLLEHTEKIWTGRASTCNRDIACVVWKGLSVWKRCKFC